MKSLAVAALVLAAPAAAQEADGPWVADIYMEPGACSERETVPVSLEQVLPGDEDLLFVCVRVSGVWAGDYLYADRDAAARGARERVAVYGGGAHNPDFAARQPTEVELVAVVENCAELRRGVGQAAGPCRRGRGGTPVLVAAGVSYPAEQ